MEDILDEFWYNWKIDPFPKDCRMKILEDFGVRGMSSENFRFLINELVKRHAKTYLEVGTWHGCSLLSAAMFNPDVRCIGIDNFKHHNKTGENAEILSKNIKRMDVDNVLFINGDDAKDLVPYLERNGIKIDVYFYDGFHSYESQYNGLTRVLPYMADNCFIAVDDCDYKQVKKANNQFLEENKDFEVVFEISGNSKFSNFHESNWWNGYQIFQRKS